MAIEVTILSEELEPEEEQEPIEEESRSIGWPGYVGPAGNPGVFVHITEREIKPE